MGEYWNQFLQWLGFVGQQQQQSRIAPRVEDRFANSYRYYEGDNVFNTLKYPGSNRGVMQDAAWNYRPAWIMRNIDNNGDTLYVENPEQKRGFNRSTKRRSASNRDKNRKEYDILKRRFNTAWNIAKEQE